MNYASKRINFTVYKLKNKFKTPNPVKNKSIQQSYASLNKWQMCYFYTKFVTSIMLNVLRISLNNNKIPLLPFNHL